MFIWKQRNNKILTWYGRRNDTFCANRPLTGVTITFIRCLYRVTGVSIGQGVVELSKFIPIHSLILSPHLFFCLPLFLFPFTVPCRIVFAKPEDLETWPNHLSSRFLTRVRSSTYSPMAAWIFLRTSSFVKWSLCEMFNSLR